MKHNWDSIKQDLINDLAVIKKDTRSKLLTSIKQDIKSVSNNEIDPKIIGNGVSIQFDSTEEYQKGKFYFDKIYDSIDQNYINKNT